MKYAVELRQISKYFDSNLIVDQVSLSVETGEFFSLLGPSGCGKTTCLRIIAGFEHANSGSVLLNGDIIDNVPPYKRDVNLVFQNYALFPHMTVYKNVAFGLEMKNVSKQEIDSRVKESLAMVKMEKFVDRFPNQLSGGQQQRVSLARALIVRPSVVLLDEPLGALDLQLRREMQIELKRLQQQLGLTFIYVTHDQEEALSLSDRMAVMNHGQIEQVGTPQELYNRPATEFVARFIGETNLFDVKFSEQNDEISHFSYGRHRLAVKTSVELADDEHPYILSVRPEMLSIQNEPPADGRNLLAGKIDQTLFMGNDIRYAVLLEDGKSITVRQPAKVTESFQLGQHVLITWPTDCGHLIKPFSRMT